MKLILQYFKTSILLAILLYCISCDQKGRMHAKRRSGNCPVVQENNQPMLDAVQIEDSKMVAPAPAGNANKSKVSPISGQLANAKIAEKEIQELPVINQSESPVQEFNTEAYDKLVENDYLAAAENPISTFSIDVDGASYSNTRRFIDNGNLPPQDAVRIEEFINYFDYNYEQPKGAHPFSVNLEMAACPWNSAHKLVHVGLQGKKVPFAQLDPLNLVFLLDVSGSMEDNNKLPLLKKSFRMLLNKLRPQDKVAIVVYAGAAGLVLPSTAGNEKGKILDALDQLQAGGSTAGGEGIELAYQVAKENKISKGQNRVILATDGDFNVGVSSDGEMTRLIEEKRREGIYLTALGVGMGNYKDSKMESMADNGNGNYFYIDNIQEAQKVLVTELDGTVYAIAKDVKLQVEFNPAIVNGYRLIGYENRMLKKEDFNNDKKDAGELGAGHSVTALYEIIPADSKEQLPSVDKLKYVQTPKRAVSSPSKEILTVKFRYKSPEDSVSKLMVNVLEDRKTSLENTSENFRFSAAVASFGMILRESAYKGTSSFEEVVRIASGAKGNDDEGYRSEFIRLVKTASILAEQAQSKR